MNREVLIGNLSTVIKIIIIIIAPSAAIYMGTDSDTAIALLTAIAGALFALIDAKYPNNILSDNNE